MSLFRLGEKQKVVQFSLSIDWKDCIIDILEKGSNVEKVSFVVPFGGSNDPSECLCWRTAGEHGARNAETGNGSAGDRQHAHRRRKWEHPNDK